MPNEDPKDLIIRSLESELKSLQSLTARSEVIAQNLRDTQHKLDVHIDQFARIHEYAQRAFAATDAATLFEILAEGVIDIMQIEAAGVFDVNIADEKISLLTQMNLETEKTEFDFSSSSWKNMCAKGDFMKSKAVYESPAENQPWTELGLCKVIYMPFFHRKDRKCTLIFGGVTHENSTIYDFEPKNLLSPFMVYCQQMHGILGLFEAIDQANEAGKAKGRFLANLSHEIRTPMNAIVGMAQIADRSDEPEEIDRCVKQIIHSSKHLLGLINDVLDIAKIEDGKLKLLQESFDLRQAVETVRLSIVPLASDKLQQFTVDLRNVTCTHIFGDEMRLSQVLINLLGNAVKFTPNHGKVRLEVSEFSRDENSVTLRFCVEDTGIGISREFLDRLFKPFEQSDASTSRDYGGTGLGLAISQHIVELMGGQIKVESELGHGTSFYFYIGFKIDHHKETQQPTEQPSAEAGPPDLSGCRILVVDDVKVNRVIITSFLRGTKADVEEAENGRDAVEKVLASPHGYFSLVFMDMQMPVMDGCTATRNIRASGHPDALSLPIIAMTANVFKEDIQEVLNAGMNGHIGKPIDFQLVLNTIRKFSK